MENNGLHHDIKPGLTHELQVTVTDQNTAVVFGSSALPVFATPYMIALMEGAASRSVRPLLPPGYATVGTKVNVEHVAALKPGAEVRAVAVLTEVEGRRLTFEVNAYSGETRIGFGTHERFIVNAERFMAKIDTPAHE